MYAISVFSEQFQSSILVEHQERRKDLCVDLDQLIQVVVFDEVEQILVFKPKIQDRE